MSRTRGKTRWVTAGVVLGLGLLVARAGGSVAPGGARVSAGQGGEPQQATDAPTAEPVAPVGCRVVAEALETAVEQDSVWAWSTLQNVGSSAVSLSALQAGWFGAGALAEVVLDSGAAVDALYRGDVASPASVGLRSAATGSEPWLAPGSTVRVGLRFEGATAEDLSIVAAVLHVRQGCAVALHRSPAAACRLEASDVRRSANDPRRVVLSVRNRAPKSVELRALDAYWPEETNGGLRAIVLGGEMRHDLDEVLTSPAALVLERVFSRPVTLAPGASLAIWLEFENHAAERPYVVTAATSDGCVASSTTWLDAPACGMKAGEFETRGLRARLGISNRLPAPQTATTLDLFWPVGVNGALIGVTLDGYPIWRGRQETSPASLMLEGAPPIEPLRAGLFEFSFAPSDGTEPAPPTGSIAGQDYTVVVGLSGGCRLVYSTLRGPAAGCSVTAGSLLPRDGEPEIEASLTNTGGQAHLRRLLVSWPTRNGNLREVRFGSGTLYSGDEPAGSRPLVIIPPPGTGDLSSQSTQPLVLRFAEAASRSGYALSLSFADAEGAACTDMVIAPPVSSGCALSVPRLEQEASPQVDAIVRNDGTEDVELSFVNVNWPTDDGGNALVRVLLVEGDQEHMIWSGEHRLSPVRIALDGVRAAVLAPSETVSLRLVFERLEHVGDVATAIGLTVGTVEGCQASYPADNRVTRPERESFDGQIVALPAVDVWGWWTVQAQWGAARETRKVLVSSSTRLDPPSIHPHVGDLVVVEALRYEDGWHAEKVTVRAGEKRVQLVGRIVDLDRSVSGASRPGWLRISSYADRLWIVSDTYVDGRLSVGAQAVVVGSVGADGSVTAVSVKIVTPSVAEPVTVRGTVQSARMAPESGATMQQWVLDKYYVLADAANPATRLEDPRGRLPVSGERFEVRGLLTENVITASVITDLGQRKVMRVDGTAVSVPPGSTIGAWTVRSAEGVETSFTVETSAVVDVRSAPAVPGVRVRAVLEEAAPGRWVALSVQTDWPGP